MPVFRDILDFWYHDELDCFQSDKIDVQETNMLFMITAAYFVEQTSFGRVCLGFKIVEGWADLSFPLFCNTARWNWPDPHTKLVAEIPACYNLGLDVQHCERNQHSRERGRYYGCLQSLCWANPDVMHQPPCYPNLTHH